MPAFKDLFKVIDDNPAPPPTDQDILAQIEQEVKAHPILVYMKGDRTQPQCGFSAAVVDILEEVGVPFQSRDVLTDPDLRQGIKAFSNWPTIPQVYVQGEFIGGCDIITDMHQQNTLRPLLESAVK